MSQKFITGDQVQLKSGGPQMTVNAVYSDAVECAWFTGAKSNKANFKPDALKPYEEEKNKDVKK
ncbi:YodC family protein [Methylobacterium iners]|uniref:YodC family protein n=1 Tax=Methylobacterium iners TaxID=418707 RepID=UPI001EE19F7B|nr:DUF2158 domain-containing protein [Methylobacterium iners]